MITATLKKLRYRPGIRVALHDAPAEVWTALRVKPTS